MANQETHVGAWQDRDAIAYHAVARPEKVACRSLVTGESFTYAALDREIAQCAGLLLQRIKAPKGARVSALARNSPAMIVLAYACARIGAIFIPLNWRLTGPELRPILDQAAPAFLVCDREFENTISGAFTGYQMSVDDFRRAVAQATPPASMSPSDPCDPWVVLFTSGTTGRPKGVPISRQIVFFSSFNFITVSGLTSRSVSLCDAPMFHTVGLIAVSFSTLQCGATVLISDRFVPTATLGRLADDALGITHYFGVPQMVEALAAEPTWAKADLSRLTALCVGGGPLSEATVGRYTARGIPIANGYGLSEGGTVLCMPLDVKASEAKPGSAGLASPAIDIRIVMSDGSDAAPGDVGEIWLRGPSVISAYWNPREGTESFKDGWLKTGDAARRDVEGFYYLVDRWKDMYISGGENVYPAEVELALSTLPGLAEVAVIGVPDAKWGETGCVFVVATADLTTQAILDHCTAHLARYKRPGFVRWIDALPRTASGKVRKDQLRARFAESPDGAGSRA